MEAKQLWQTVLGELERRLSRSAFDNWLRQTSLIGFADDVATVAGANTFCVSTLRSRYRHEIEGLLSQIVGRPIRAEFAVLNADGAAEPEAIATSQRPMGAAAAVPVADRDRHSTVRPQPRGRSAPVRNVARRQLELTAEPNHGLNPRYVFEHYVVGSSNRFAHAASLAVAEQPGGKYNPLFIYGGVGLGKTHLLHAIGHRALQVHPGSSVLYVSSEKFTNDVIDAIRAQRMDEFRGYYRTIDILMIDDIQFIAGKDATQEEFFHTFNALYQNGKQVVMSSDKPPKAIGGLAERLRSRFEGGLIVDVQLPDYEMRTAILRAKGDEFGVALPADVIEYVAQRDQSNIRELEGALNKILAYAEMARANLSLPLAMQALTESTGTRRTKRTAAEVLDAVGSQFQVTMAELKGRSRSREVVLPRQIAMLLIREETGASLVEVGQELGGRDHTTVMHGIEKVERAMEIDGGLRAQVNAVREALV